MDGTIRIIDHLIHIHRATLIKLGRDLLQQIVTVSKNIGFSFQMNDAGVIAARLCRSIDDHPFIFPGSCGLCTDGIANSFRTACGGIGHIVKVIAFPDPGPFLVIPGCGRILHDLSGIGDHILIQPDIIDFGVSPVHVCLAIIVNHNGRVNVMVAVADQRSSDRIPERTIGSIGNKHTYPDTTGHGAVKIKLSVSFNTLYRPGTIVVGHPFKVFQRSNSTVLRPVDHVGG